MMWTDTTMDKPSMSKAKVGNKTQKKSLSILLDSDFFYINYARLSEPFL